MTEVLTSPDTKLEPPEPKMLSQFFHPVARADEVDETPKTFRLLGEDVLLYRNAEGEPVAFRDLCVHRGARLSLGELTPEGNLRCPYHGWEYASDGRCVRIPSLPEGSSIPARARAFRFAAEERYDIVWVAIDDPITGVPTFPNGEWDDPAWRGFVVYAQEWDAAAGRILENFCDLSHAPWVHPQMTSRDNCVIEPYDVWRTDLTLGMSFDVPSEEGASGPGTSNLPFGVTRDASVFTVHLPFSVHLHQVVGDNGETTIVSMLIAPLGPKRSRVFLLNTRNHHLEPEHDEAMSKFALELAVQDRRIVESQRPEMVPLELREEMHLKVPDAFSIVYRRLLDEFGPEDTMLRGPGG